MSFIHLLVLICRKNRFYTVHLISRRKVPSTASRPITSMTVPSIPVISTVSRETGFWPLGAPCGENAPQRACTIAPGVDLKYIAFGKVHPVEDNDLPTLFQTQQGVPVLLIDNQFPADRRFAPLPGAHARTGDRSSDYSYRLQDYFHFCFFFLFFHIRLFPLWHNFNGQPEIFGQMGRLARETYANHV